MQFIDSVLEKIVAAIGSAGLLGAIRALWKRRKAAPLADGIPQADASIGEKTDVVMLETPTAEASDPPPKYIVVKGERVLNAREAHAAFVDAPFLQRADIAKHYLGLKAGTIGELHSMWPSATFNFAGQSTEGKITIHIAGADGVSVFTDVYPSAFAGLSLLKRGAHIAVIGTILNVSEWGVSLDDADLEFE